MRTPLLALAAFAVVTSACSDRESRTRPPTDEVHGFLDLLDRLARMDE